MPRGCTESESDQAIEMLFLRVSNSGIWHRLFLDAGIGFWGTYTEEDAFFDYLNVSRIDFADRWNLTGTTIVTADCFGTELDEPGLSAFRITFSSGTLSFRYADQNDMDSGTLLEFLPNTNNGTEQSEDDQAAAAVESKP